MTDFTRFLNSKDIAEHLRKLNYEFSPEEAAYAVHEARNIPLSEKHEAYRELIARYPDFERCRNVPENKKVLMPLSAYMKGEISVDLLLNAYRYHVLKEMLSKAKDGFSLYSQKGLLLMGILPE